MEANEESNAKQRREEKVLNKWTLQGVEEVSDSTLNTKPLRLDTEINIDPEMMGDFLDYNSLLPLGEDMICREIEKDESKSFDTYTFSSKYQCNILEKTFKVEQEVTEGELHRNSTLKDDIYKRQERQLVRDVQEAQMELVHSSNEL